MIYIIIFIFRCYGNIIGLPVYTFTQKIKEIIEFIKWWIKEGFNKKELISFFCFPLNSLFTETWLWWFPRGLYTMLGTHPKSSVECPKSTVSFLVISHHNYWSSYFFLHSFDQIFIFSLLSAHAQQISSLSIPK